MIREIGVLKILHASLNPDFRLGGPGLVVEVDEAKFGRRKYHRGRHVDGVWVFGAIQRESENTPRRMLLYTVPNRSEETLISLIQKWIIPGIFFINIGTIIISDGWTSYLNIGDYGYTHEVVVHQENFVDPITGAHTNTIEGNWRWARNFMPETGTRKWLYNSYFLEFTYRKTFLPGAVGQKFNVFLEHVKEIYNPHQELSFYQQHGLSTAMDFFLPRPLNNNVF